MAGDLPAQVNPAAVLVGLLTSASEVPAFSSPPGSAVSESLATMAVGKEWDLPMHGHSGGAVPDLHRCSLFVEHPGRMPNHQHRSERDHAPIIAKRQTLSSGGQLSAS